MKSTILISTIIFIVFSSCNNLPVENNTLKSTPEALEDHGNSESFVKRVNEDMVESLYKDLVKKTPELKDFEKEIENISQDKDDSGRLYKNFDYKNKEYYSAANANAEKINDAILKEKIKVLIFNNQSKYSSKVHRFEDLLNSVDLKTVALIDLHNFLKITRTLPVIEEYQNKNIPTTKSLDAVSKRLDLNIKKAGTLINQ